MDNLSFLYRSTQFFTIFITSGLLSGASKIILSVSPTAFTIIILGLIAFLLRGAIGHWLFQNQVKQFAKFSLLGGLLGTVLGLLV